MTSISRVPAACFLTVTVALALLAAGNVGALAQNPNPLSSSYVTPFPQTDRYQVRVIGDWLGPGLASGLQDAFKQDASVQIQDASKSNYGLARTEQISLFSDIDKLVASGAPVHIAVVMLGVNDVISMKAPTGTGRLQPGTAEWKDAYGREAEKLIRRLKAANIAVYWLGLPVMANSRRNDAVAAMNDAVRQAAYVNGAKFIETSTGFTDQSGGYAAYGPDLTGRTKRLREGDGVGFTAAGSRKLANYVEIVLRRDLAQAKAQRNIPLAGDEEEQARVVPGTNRAAKGAAGSKSGWTAETGIQPEVKPAPATPQATTAAEDNAPASNDQRREQAAFAGPSGFQGGELIFGDLDDGMTAIAVISPVGEFSMREIQRQTPLADRLYFKVLRRGDALPPKEGRADDFKWREDDVTSQQ
ncbi:DUF459 domain-containing protein [Rhodomicrobium sp. Az07]|uniref:SGNH/GDSL hydrolase family protein n=1 Tax=Rhodomicrobium sp. Az07 TaxID=2839034 RepID=UPI001BE9830E|nr:GDSL-type esterase/lipase family protein [Rhodomicrobium sp. Az07]MBT3069513.1 DUF459 domain-containing protein [Rhodomicrobium sp. Az07]